MSVMRRMEVAADALQGQAHPRFLLPLRQVVAIHSNPHPVLPLPKFNFSDTKIQFFYMRWPHHLELFLASWYKSPLDSPLCSHATTQEATSLRWGCKEHGFTGRRPLQGRTKLSVGHNDG